jgi:hypothetical protein
MKPVVTAPRPKSKNVPAMVLMAKLMSPLVAR